ncbi:MAG: hypothetical protein ABIK28_14625 [Planctomycetota bacterium]
MLKYFPVLLIVLVLCGCTVQSLNTVAPTLDSIEGLKYTDAKPAFGTASGFFLFPVLPGPAVGGLLKLEGSDAMFKEAYDKARESVGADALIHYSYEMKVDWYWIVGWATITCNGTGIKYQN